jgi:hypothetical protein
MSYKHFLGGFIIGGFISGVGAIYNSRVQQRAYVQGLNSIESQAIQCGQVIINELRQDFIAKYIRRDLESKIGMEFVKLKKTINQEKIKYLEFQ